MHNFMFPGPFFGLAFALAPVLLLIFVWTVVIKGYALWTAARAGQLWWFIALLVINTIGILELVYLIWFAPPGSNKLSGIFSARGKSVGNTSSPQA